MNRTVLSMLVLAALLLSACAPTQTTLEGTACPTGTAKLDLGGCCPDADGNGVCDTPQIAPPPSQEEPPTPTANSTETPPIANETNTTKNVTASQDVVGEYRKRYEQRVRTYTYYLDTPEYGELWIWQDKSRIRYITVDRLFEVRRNRVNDSQYVYSKHDNNLIYAIQDRSKALTNYLEYNRSTTTYGTCYVQGPRYSLGNCIKDYPNNNEIYYGGVKFAAPRDPVAWLFSFEGQEPTQIVPNQRFRDKEGQLSDAERVTFTQQNGDKVTFLVHTTFGAPLQVTVIDRWGTQKESFEMSGIAFNNQYTIDGDPRLEPELEYR